MNIWSLKCQSCASDYRSCQVITGWKLNFLTPDTASKMDARYGIGIFPPMNDWCYVWHCFLMPCLTSKFKLQGGNHLHNSCIWGFIMMNYCKWLPKLCKLLPPWHGVKNGCQTWHRNFPTNEQLMLSLAFLFDAVSGIKKLTNFRAGSLA